MPTSTLLIIVLVLLLVGAVPAWPYSRSWGYYPSGLLGVVLLGVFAGTGTNPSGAQGLIHGAGGFFGKEVAAGLAACVYTFIFTLVMLRLIDWITPVRVGREEQRGLDAAELGEAAYTLEPSTESPPPAAGNE